MAHPFTARSGRVQILDLNDEIGSNRVLEELVRYLPEDDCRQFVEHLHQVWELNADEVTD